MPSLATAADIGAILGRPVSDEEVASFDQLNLLKSAVVEGYCKRSFLTATDTRIITVTDGTLRLPNPPIVEVTGITARFNWWTTGWTELDYAPDVVLIDPDGTLTNFRYGYWPAARYEVTYAHGSDVAPDDVRMVTAELIYAAMEHQPSVLTTDQKRTLRRYRPAMSTIELVR